MLQNGTVFNQNRALASKNHHTADRTDMLKQNLVSNARILSRWVEGLGKSGHETEVHSNQPPQKKKKKETKWCYMLLNCF